MSLYICLQITVHLHTVIILLFIHHIFFIPFSLNQSYQSLGALRDKKKKNVAISTSTSVGMFFHRRVMAVLV